MPRVARRLCFRVLIAGAVLIVALMAAMIAAFIVIPSLPVTTLLWAGYPFALGVTLIALTYIAWIPVSLYRMQRRLMAHAPNVCLNCAYPLSLNPHPEPPICPECGHRNNLQDLNKGWKRTLRLPE